jgi:Skp family chaperone for outer membrane proteins
LSSGAAIAGWYNDSMPKEKKKRARKNDKASAEEKAKKSEADSSAVELEEVKTTKKGEPDDNLRRRAEWFQKRRSGA